MQRESFLLGALAVPLAGPAAPRSFASIEARTGGRLGVVAIDTGNGRTIAHRAHERFPLCSTFKLLAVAAVLERVDRGAERLDRRIAYGPADLLDYAPVTRAHVRDGSLTIGALCAAAIAQSDNTAANLLLRSLGGPAAVTRYARTLGDGVTRLDRTEPSLNSALPGDPRDTTSPFVMAANLRRLMLGDALSATSRQRLAAWLIATRTGDATLRAGTPKGWRVGDKTGSGANGTRNDVAILWRPNGAPLIVAAYLTGATVAADARDAALADVARLVTRT